jgi:PRC-barrel domain
MLKTLTMSAAVSALMVSGALAQASPPADKSASQPMAQSNAAPVNSPHFIHAQGTDKWVFSKFKGTNVLGPDDQKVGDVTDLLFDKNGKIDGLIIGVGGFLGIGEKDVAIDMSAFQVVPYTTGSATGATNTSASDNDPTLVKLKVTWTKDQLKNAPDFQYYRPAPRVSERPGAAPTTGMAPRPTAPAPVPAPAPRQ